MVDTLNLWVAGGLKTLLGELGGFYVKVPKTCGAGFLFVNEAGYQDLIRRAGYAPDMYQMMLYAPTLDKFIIAKAYDGETAADTLLSYNDYYELIKCLTTQTTLTNQDIINAITHSRRGGGHG